MASALYFRDSLDPYGNLAAEERLCQICGGVTLYLWQNRDTVVIGKNQSALRECDLAALRRDGVKLARRSTGGGAVFHDEGNLNFSVIFPSKELDKSIGYAIVRRAMEALDVPTAVSGRNDITLRDGRKFSGNAFRYADGVTLHHGTLLINSELSRMGAYLRPTAEKLRTHGVESVRARVANLSEIRQLTLEEVKTALINSFQELYGVCDLRPVPDDPETEALRQQFSSDAWLYEKEPAADLMLEHRFSWGSFTMALKTEKGIITQAKVFTDSMNPALSGKLENALIGVSLRSGTLSEAVKASGAEEGESISSWLQAISF